MSYGRLFKAAARKGVSAKGNLAGRRPKYLFSGLLKCAECGANYVIKSGAYYGCASNINRGPEVCKNSRQVLRTRLEETLLQVIFDEVFSPETVAYLTKKVNEALAKMSEPAQAAHKRKKADLSRARTELENIKAAIRQGILTPTTRGMLEEAERRVVELEASIQTPPRAEVAVLQTIVAPYLHDLRRTLGRDTDRARYILSKLIGRVCLRRNGEHLIAELYGNLHGILDIPCDNSGAGSPSRIVPYHSVQISWLPPASLRRKLSRDEDCT